MSRVIKFRAWDKHTKEMYQDVTIQKEENNVRPWAYMQYTGLKDKNGKEIYEGDIIKGEVIRHWIIADGSDLDITIVKWEDGGFEPFANSGSECFSVESTDVEIIGNIHENPELIKVVKQ